MKESGYFPLFVIQDTNKIAFSLIKISSTIKEDGNGFGGKSNSYILFKMTGQLKCKYSNKFFLSFLVLFDQSLYLHKSKKHFVPDIKIE